MDPLAPRATDEYPAITRQRMHLRYHPTMRQMTIAFCTRCEKLAQAGSSLAQIQAAEQATEEEVREALRMLGAWIREPAEPVARPSVQERAAVREKVPQKWRSHYGPEER